MELELGILPSSDSCCFHHVLHTSPTSSYFTHTKMVCYAAWCCKLVFAVILFYYRNREHTLFLKQIVYCLLQLFLQLFTYSRSLITKMAYFGIAKKAWYSLQSSEQLCLNDLHLSNPPVPINVYFFTFFLFQSEAVENTGDMHTNQHRTLIMCQC